MFNFRLFVGLKVYTLLPFSTYQLHEGSQTNIKETVNTKIKNKKQILLKKSSFLNVYNKVNEFSCKYYIIL